MRVDRVLEREGPLYTVPANMRVLRYLVVVMRTLFGENQLPTRSAHGSYDVLDVSEVANFACFERTNMAGKGRSCRHHEVCVVARFSFLSTQLKMDEHFTLTLIRMLYKMCGQQGTAATFLMTEAEMKDETFLEIMNSFLMTGEIPNLFPKVRSETATAKHVLFQNRTATVFVHLLRWKRRAQY